MDQQNISCLLVEDDASTASMIIDLMREHDIGLTWSADGQNGLYRAGTGAFDVLILDRMLPDIDGLSIVARLRVAGVKSPILMLSALGRAENRIEGLDAGVDDYLGKPFDPAELIARVRALARRAQGSASPTVILFGDLECHIKARTAYRQGQHVPLSPKEFTLFRYLMDNAGEVVTRDMLLRHVWKLNFDPQTNVVDVNIGRLRRKLEDGFASPVLETVWGTGYRLLAG